MRRAIIAVGAGALLLLGILVVLRALESPESRIRARLQRMADDFDRGRAGPCARGLADDFVDETTGARAEEVRGILARMILTERDPRTKELLHRVDLPEEEMTVHLDPADPARARVELVAVFEEQVGGEWRLGWRVEITAEMREGEGGWRVHRTTHRTLAGQRIR